MLRADGKHPIIYEKASPIRLRLACVPLLVLIAVAAISVVGTSLQPAYAGGAGSAESDLLLIDGNYYVMKIVTDPGILDGEDRVVMTLVMLDDDASPAVPISDVEYRLRMADGDGTTLAELDVYSPDTNSTIVFVPTDKEEEYHIYGETSETGGSWLASANSPPVVQAPMFLEGGIVYIYATVLSMGSEVVPDGATFEIMYSMGERIPFMMMVDGNHFELDFVTFFDRITDFVHDGKAHSVSAHMPFKWSEEFIRSAQFVHAEYYIPKTLWLFEDHEVLISVNGLDYFGTVDRSSEDLIIVHFMLSAPKMLELLEQLGPDAPDEMIFEIAAGDKRQQINKAASLESGDTVIVPSGAEDGREFHNLHLSIEPAGMIHPGHELVLNLEFRSLDSSSLVTNVEYDLLVMLDGETILVEDGMAARDGRDSAGLAFDRTGFATVQITSNAGDAVSTASASFAVSEPHDMGAHGDMTMTKSAGGHDMPPMSGHDMPPMSGHDMPPAESMPRVEHLVDMAVNSYQLGCEIDDSCYIPATIEIMVGQDVLWINQDGMAHTVTSGSPGAGTSGLFDSGIVSYGNTYKRTFDVAGVFDYYCTLHPWMTGVVSVAEAAPDTPQSQEIPAWVRNSAQWWSEGILDDSTFITSLEFLINDGIIKIPDGVELGGSMTGGDSMSIPAWVRNSAQWWSEGILDDSTFLGALEWLIVNGIIRLQ